MGSASSLKRARAVHRALDVLEFLGEHGASSLHAMHLGTGLSKSTLRRLLATLVERGYVRCGLTDRMYRANVATPLSLDESDAPRIGRLTSVARPHMIMLTRTLRWPVGLHFYVGGRMRVIETTHGMSPFGPTAPVAADSELNIFAAASGLAWLAAQDNATVLKLVDSLAGSEAWSLARFGVTPAQLLGELEIVRQRGWAKRRTAQRASGDHDGAAVALFEKGRSTGALTLTWRRGSVTEDTFAAEYLAAFQDAAAAINAAL